MANPELIVRDAVVTAIQGVSGLSDKVIIGRPNHLGSGTTPPCVWVAVRSAIDQYGPDLGAYKTELVLDIYILAPADSSMPEDRENAILDLGFSVREAVRDMPDPTGVRMLAAPNFAAAMSPEATQGLSISVMLMQSTHLFISESV